jgi:hypothetical protein
MRNNRTLGFSVLAGFLALVLFALPAMAENLIDVLDPILGTWQDTAYVPTPTGPVPAFNTVVSFSIEGNLLVTANLPNVTIGQGTFVKTGDRTYTDTFYFFRPDPSSSLLLTTKVVENIKVSKDGTTYVADALIQPLDANGNVIAAGVIPATVTARRFPLGSYSAHP